MTMGALVRPLLEPYDSIFLTTSMPSTTLPKTVCLPSVRLLLFFWGGKWAKKKQERARQSVFIYLFSQRRLGPKKTKEPPRKKKTHRATRS